MHRLLLIICVVSSVCFGQSSRPQARATPLQERDALIALYNATDGEHWKNHDGWLGPVGTECRWHGVQCEVGTVGGSVTGIDLFENNLVGRIPDALGDLPHLEWLNLLQNRVTGNLPERLVQRWMQGTLGIAAESSLFTTVTEVDFESVATEILCAQHRIVLRNDGSVVQYTEKCRATSPKDRRTFCEVKEGRIWPGDFARLGVSLERYGFSDLRPNYERAITHGQFRSMRVIAGRKTREVVEYADAGPFQLWLFQMTIEGIAAQAEWDKTTSQPTCPRWESIKSPTR